MQTEQNKINDLIVRRIKLRCQRRIAWLRKLWTDASTPNDNSKPFDSHAEVDGTLVVFDSIAAESAWYETDESVKSLNQAISSLEHELATYENARFIKLARLFALSEADVNVLQACLALYLEPSLGRVYAYLHDHAQRSFVTRQLASRLFQQEEIFTLGSASPLFRWGIIVEQGSEKSEPAKIELDPFIRNWLFGSDDIDPVLSNVGEVRKYYVPLRSWKVEEMAKSIEGLLTTTQVVRVFVSGSEGTGRRSLATAICKELQLPLLSLQCNSVTIDQWNVLFMRAQRQAWISNCALLWEGGIAFENQWPSTAPFPLQFVVGDSGDSILHDARITDITFEIPPISSDEALELWKAYVPSATEWPEEELIQLIKRQPVGIGVISSVSKRNLRNVAEVSDALRGFSRGRLGDLAQLINSSFSWDDLVVPKSLRNSLDDLYFEAAERAVVWEEPSIQKHFPQGRGLIVLLTGAPGTGKTMAAQVIANSLQLDLFRIDLSVVVSKYIGETSKNIEKILSRAARMNAVLLFDEADSLFGQRTDIDDAHARYANMDTNYLLQAIEDYPGIAILSSNKKSNIDSAFIRRIRYALDFPKPDAAQRQLIWKKLLTELLQEKTGEELTEGILKFSELIEVTGAQIKQSILSAIFISMREKKKIEPNHLLKGLERELMKESRGLGKRVLELTK